MTTTNPMPYHILRDPEKSAERRRAIIEEVRGGASVTATAARHGVSRQTIYTWLGRAEANGGLVPLESKGPDCRLTVAQRERLASLIAKWPREVGVEADRWTLPRVRELIEREFGVRYASGHVGEILKDLGFSRQKPERQARQRDAEKVEEWKRTVLPRVEKKGGAGGGGLRRR